MADELLPPLTFSVHEAVGMGDFFGGPPRQSRRSITKDEAEALLKRMVPPHHNKGRDVTEEDLPRVVRDADDMVIICQIPTERFAGGKALSHTQIEDKDPLNFFVLSNGIPIVNPVIVNHTSATVDRTEGCLTFPFKDPITVKRFNKVTVQFNILTVDRNGKTAFSPRKEENLNGEIAQIMQHEISHLLGHYVYDEDYKAEHCLKDSQ